MYDMAKLKGRIVEKFGTQKAFAQALNKPEGYVSMVLSGKAYLTSENITEWANTLGIDLPDVGEFFLCLKSHKCEKEGA